jgi:hypothetical protein
MRNYIEDYCQGRAKRRVRHEDRLSSSYRQDFRNKIWNTMVITVFFVFQQLPRWLLATLLPLAVPIQVSLQVDRKPFSGTPVIRCLLWLLFFIGVIPYFSYLL